MARKIFEEENFGKIKIRNEISRLLWNFLSSQLPPFSIFGPGSGPSSELRRAELGIFPSTAAVPIDAAGGRREKKGLSISLFLCLQILQDSSSYFYAHFSRLTIILRPSCRMLMNCEIPPPIMGWGGGGLEAPLYQSLILIVVSDKNKLNKRSQ